MAGYALLAYAIGSIVFIYILIFGQSKFHRNGIVGRLNRAIRDAPDAIGSTCCLALMCFNRPKAQRQWSSVSAYMMDKPNPALIIFFCVMVGTAEFGYFKEVVPRQHSLFEQLFSVLFCACGWASFTVGCKSDPGTVVPLANRGALAPRDRAVEAARDCRFRADGALYAAEASPCRTCGVDRPARSKHSKIGGHCVRRFDHYCPWLANDIGERNLRWFHLFVLTHAALCLYACYVCASVMNDIAWELRLPYATFVDSTGHQYAATIWSITYYVMHRHPWIGGVGTFCGFVAVMLFGFFLFNFRFVWWNCTTNERYKIDDLIEYISAFVEYDNLYREAMQSPQPGGPNGEGPPRPTEDVVRPPSFCSPSSALKLVADYRAQLIACNGNAKKALRAVDRSLLRTYHRGRLQNIVEVLFPDNAVDGPLGGTPAAAKAGNAKQDLPLSSERKSHRGNKVHTSGKR